MKKLFFACLLLTFGLSSEAAVLKIATVTPEGSQWMTDMRNSAKEIKERTEGRVQIKYYGGGVMGNAQKVLSRIRIGSLQGGAFTPSELASQYKDLNLYGLPMVFDSEEEAAYARGHLDAKLKAGLEDAGWVNFGFAGGGFAILMSNTPISTLDDLKGKKVWVPEGDNISRHSMEAMSLSPVSLPLTDVLTGLQTGLIDIVAMSPIGALVLQWHTKVKYITELPLVYTMGFMAVDKRAFNKISEADQAIVREVMERTYRNFDKQNLIDNRGARDALLNAGLESVPFDVEEYQRIREVLMVSTAALGEQGLFSAELFEEMLRYAQEYRGQPTAESRSTL
ncbi:MAG: TRAP transporter substrate-binding protein DctP [Gammaproteobacteria bacterium]|nr:TRAP transporter substrate-binding protein DctP [Gammaproteobacteria bacterium]